jgi:hypothetical protein
MSRAHPLFSAGHRRSRCRSWLAVLAFLAVCAAGGATAGPAGARSAADGPTRPSVYWGAWIGSQFTGTDAPWSMGAVASFEALARKRVSLVQFASPFADCRSGRCVDFDFPKAAFDNVRAHGAIPFFSWASYAVPMRPTQRRYRLADIASGRHDRYIRRWATAAAKWGHPFFLRFDWEMNGHWFPWSEGVNGNRPGEFARAWRHVHDIFRSVGAANATWVWCPNADYAGSGTPLRGLYPGDAYVDWTCLDGYNRNEPRKPFSSVFTTPYDLVAALAPGKPMAIGETASTERGGSKAAWIAGMFAVLPRFSNVKALLWFEKYDSGQDWPIETSRSATEAFARGVASPRYAPNAFGSLAGGRIAPLSPVRPR